MDISEEINGTIYQKIPVGIPGGVSKKVCGDFLEIKNGGFLETISEGFSKGISGENFWTNN